MEENLGRAVPWQIKEFPEQLRRDLTEAARKHRQTVGEFLAHYALALRALDWPEPQDIHRAFDGTGAVNGIANRGKPVKPGALREAVEMACMVAEHAAAMPKGVANLANGLIKNELRAMRPPGQTRGGSLALAPPVDAAP